MIIIYCIVNYCIGFFMLNYDCVDYCWVIDQCLLCLFLSDVVMFYDLEVFGLVFFKVWIGFVIDDFKINVCFDL